jgi:hypothetical protein
MLVYSMWETMRALLIPGEPMEFASRVPVNAEDWLNVPVIVDATTLPGVAETVVFASAARGAPGDRASDQAAADDTVWHLGGH